MPHDFQFLMYNTVDGEVSINAIVKDETIWLTQRAMAQLFDCSTDNISLHLKNIYQTKELDEAATTEDFSAVQSEGKAEAEYALFNPTQKIVSDFDRVIKQMEDNLQ